MGGIALGLLLHQMVKRVLRRRATERWYSREDGMRDGPSTKHTLVFSVCSVSDTNLKRLGIMIGFFGF